MSSSPRDPWSRRFRTPIPLPGGGSLRTLADARAFLLSQDDPKPWAVAVEALLVVVEHNGPTDFARIGMMRALYRDVERPVRKKRARRYRIIR